MQTKNKYFKYFHEISALTGIIPNTLATKIASLEIGKSIETKTHVLHLKQIGKSNGQDLYYICVYDKSGTLIRNDPVFLTRPKRVKHQ
jgi:hypothetical protein